MVLSAGVSGLRRRRRVLINSIRSYSAWMPMGTIQDLTINCDRLRRDLVTPARVALLDSLLSSLSPPQDMDFYFAASFVLNGPLS